MPTASSTVTCRRLTTPSGSNPTGRSRIPTTTSPRSRPPSRDSWPRPASTRTTSSASASTSPPARCCPTTADGTPLCELDAFRRSPHAWVKLWKHHAAQPEADRINAVAAARGEDWLPRYGGRISSEWFYAKSLQILDEAPDVYAAADRLIEATDWIVWRLTGVETRNACTAGYKAIWSKRRRLPRRRRSSRRSIRVSRRSSTTRCHASSPRSERGGRPLGRSGGLDRSSAGHACRGRQRRRPRVRPGRRRDTARHPGRGHGHQHLPPRAGRSAGDSRGHVWRRRGRDRAGPVRLRGRSIGGRRHLRVVHEAGDATGRPRSSGPRRPRRPRRPRTRGMGRSGRARAGCLRSTGGTAIARSWSMPSWAACWSGRPSPPPPPTPTAHCSN